MGRSNTFRHSFGLIHERMAKRKFSKLELKSRVKFDWKMRRQSVYTVRYLFEILNEKTNNNSS
jgi:hypothetical protein